jgi:hypothetical protein
VLLSLVLAAALAGDTNSVSQAYSGADGGIRVVVPRIEAEVTVDGVLDEPVWRLAARLTGFSIYAPVDGRPADERTEVLVWYSPGAIHFGVRAWAQAGTVRATLADRDKLASEDLVEFYLGTWNDGRQAMVFGVNPLGVQQDGSLLEGSSAGHGSFTGMSAGAGRESTDLSPDFTYSSRGRLTDYGYEIEVRIPFKSLRYQSADPQDWGLNVVRRTMLSGHEDSWVPALRARSSFLAQSGTLQGLTGLHRGLVMDVNPVVTARAVGASTDAGDWRYARAVEFGGNLRWGITPTLTLNGTVNPDFSQVESDASQVVTDPREALYFPEKRPFFLEGIEQFSVPNQLIYTRRIVAPVAATKLTGNLSGTNLAVMLAADDRALSHTGQDYPLFAIARVTHDLGEESRVGLVLTDREDGASYNRLGGVDARILVGGQYVFTAQAAASTTRTGDSVTTAPLWQLGFTRNGRQLGLNYSFRGVSDVFDAAAGFVRRRDIVNLALQHSLTFYGAANAGLERTTVGLYTAGNWRYDDFIRGQGLQDKQLWLTSQFTVRGGWSVTAMAMLESFGYDDRLYGDYAIERREGAVVDTVPYTRYANIKNQDVLLSVSTPWIGPISLTGEVIYGNDVNYSEWSPARIWIVNGTAQIRPTAQLRIDGSFILQSYVRRTDWSTVSLTRIPRLRLEYQVSRAIFLRLVGEYSAGVRDSLRDDSRTNAPVLIRDPGSGIYRREPALRQVDNRFRGDVLFSFQPTPGTVFFAGYGGAFVDAQAFGIDQFRRVGDGFFVKASYLFRL